MSIHSCLTWRVSSVLDRAASSLVPLRGNAPIFCPWAYSSVMSAFVVGGGVTSGRGNGRTVGGATEGRPGTRLDGLEKKFQPWSVAATLAGHSTGNSDHKQILTCRFDNIMWSGTRNLPSILVHTPAVSGLSITLDWTERQYTLLSNLSPKNNFNYRFCVCMCGVHLNCPSVSHWGTYCCGSGFPP